MTATPPSYDLIVLGSGAAGLSAALYASAQGKRVLVAEKSEFIGGTTAMSGGCTWIPNNHLMATIGATDSRDAALTYLRAVAPAGWHDTEDAHWQAFVDAAPQMLRFVEAHSPLRFGLGREPDPYAEAPGALRAGRNVSPRPFRLPSLGRWAARIRPSPMPALLAYNEVTDTHLFANPKQAFWRFGLQLAWRKLTGRRAMGQALVAGLLAGCLQNGCEVRTGLRAVRLRVADDQVPDGDRATTTSNRPTPRVCGAEFENGEAIDASLGVLIATGGFEWDEALMARYHPGPRRWTASPDTNTGDGLKMALALGAQLAHMDQALTMGTRPVEYLGKPHAVPAADYTLPHSMIVNPRGRRFVNELQMNVGLGLEERDPQTGARLHDPAWRIYDSQYARKYPHAMPQGPDLVRADTLEELARRCGIDPGGLIDEASKMTRFASTGRDDDLGRGGFIWDPGRSGDPRHGPNSCLGSIEVGPFYAFPFPASFLGTKGGPRTDEQGRVLHADGAAIAGLWCAGMAMANPIGSKAVGAGTTLGPCLTWGYICARTAVATRHS